MKLFVFNFEKQISKIKPIIFFIIYLLFGLLIVNDYGISWDEPTSRMNGLVNLKYIASILELDGVLARYQNIPNLMDWMDKDYGVAFELLLALGEYLFNIQERRIYLYRHIVTFIFSGFGIAALYAMTNTLYKKWYIPYFSVILLILSPRLFADSFYNSKDLVLMSSMSLAFYSMTILIRVQNTGNLILHAFLTAFAFDIRVIAIIIVPLTFVGIILSNFTSRASVWIGVKYCLLYFIFSTLFVYLMFPYLWSDPYSNLINVFAAMAKFRWHGELLYFGSTIVSSSLPWHYIISWILITTPVLYLLLFLVGICSLFLSLWRNDNFINNELRVNSLLQIFALTLPICAAIVLKSVLYDGWRQFYFVYIPFVMIATLGFYYIDELLLKFKFCRLLFYVAIFVNFSLISSWMVKSHPLQNVYFNIMAGSNWRENFDLDYWGMGNREALNLILIDSKCLNTKVNVKAISQTPLDRATLMMKVRDSERVKLVSNIEQADYLITNFRQVPVHQRLLVPYGFVEFYNRKIGEEIIYSIYKKNSLLVSECK